jgi:nucleotidyltransferase substrate binding protein (TIGR01987 family)
LCAKDIRWIQRFHNFTKALAQLTEAVALAGQRELSKLEKQGIIQAFEFTHELAWNTLKDFLENRGAQNIYGSKDATREAFKAGLIENGETWMDMIKSRNQTTHTYDEALVAEIVNAVTKTYFTEFTALQTRMNKLKEEELP